MIRLPSGNALHVAYLRAAGGKRAGGSKRIQQEPSRLLFQAALENDAGRSLLQWKMFAAMS